MIEIEGYMNNYFKNEIEIKFDAIPKKYHHTTCWFCEREFNLKDVREHPIVKDHCQLTGNF